MSNPLANIFPEPSSIPEAYRLDAYIEQREYLIGGELKTWMGELAPVLSPVFVKETSGYTQKIIGSTPLLNAAEAMRALDAAVKAHDLGKGEWPMMSVADRIAHVETFLARMREKRTEV
jgi:glyceraldehyde-3-phosphate dehydrogenase (NADP+)